MTKWLSGYLPSVATAFALTVMPALADTYAPDFKQKGPEWKRGTGTTIEVKDGIMTETAPTTSDGLALNSVLQVTDCKIEASGKLIDAPSTDNAYWGIEFCSTSPKDCYIFHVSNVGSYQICRSVGGKFSYPLPWTAGAAAKKGDWNDLKVVVSGKRADFFINNQKVRSLPIEPPAGGGLFGLIVGTDVKAKGQFKNLKVTY